MRSTWGVLALAAAPAFAQYQPAQPITCTGSNCSFPVGSSAVVGTALGGTGTASTLTLQSTSGVGATDAIIFKVGNNGATEAARVVHSGNFLLGGSTDGNYRLDVQNSGSTGTARFFDKTATTGATLVTIALGAAQTTSSTLLSVGGRADFTGSITSQGDFQAGAARNFYFSGRSTLQSPSDGVIEIGNNAASDFGRLQLGGTTSSFPALKRESANVGIRLADDSAYTGLNLAGITSSTLKSTTGTRYLCVDSSGVFSASASACSGT